MEVSCDRPTITAPEGDVTVEFPPGISVAFPQVVIANMLAEARAVDGWLVLDAALVEVTVVDGMALVILQKGVT